MLILWLVPKLQTLTFQTIKVLPCTQLMYKIKLITVFLHLPDKNKSVSDQELPIQELQSRTSLASISHMLTIKIPQCSQYGTVTHLRLLKQCALHSLHSIFLLEALEKFKIHCLKILKGQFIHKHCNTYLLYQTILQKLRQFLLISSLVLYQIKKLD